MAEGTGVKLGNDAPKADKDGEYVDAEGVRRLYFKGDPLPPEAQTSSSKSSSAKKD